MIFRTATADDLEELVSFQEEAAVAGLADIFPQDEHPFPRGSILERWHDEIVDPLITVYVSADPNGSLTGFAARRADEVLHFGTALRTWGTGLATELHDALIGTFPADIDRIRLLVFEDNLRARRFWEKQGWQPTGARTRSTYPPFAVLVEYGLVLPGDGDRPSDG